MKLSYSIWSSSDPISCKRGRWFLNWECCSRGLEIFFLCLISLHCYQISLQLRSLHLQYKYRIYCNPILSFIHLVRFPWTSKRIHIMSPHHIWSIAEAFWFDWLPPKSQELSIFSCHISKLFNFTTHNNLPFLCIFLRAYTLTKLPMYISMCGFKSNHF